MVAEERNTIWAPLYLPSEARIRWRRTQKEVKRKKKGREREGEWSAEVKGGVDGYPRVSRGNIVILCGAGAEHTQTLVKTWHSLSAHSIRCRECWKCLTSAGQKGLTELRLDGSSLLHTRRWR